MKCSQCGQENWAAGSVGELRGQAVYFKPAKSKLLVLSYPSVQAQACKICGQVVMAVDVEKLKSTLKED